jgi:hypothetical protein
VKLLRPATIASVAAVTASLVLSCGGEVEVGAFVGSGGSGSTSANGTGGGAGSGVCEPASCQTHVYACGDCVDNDSDGLIDAEDPDCLGPCHNAEDTFFGSIPGQGGSGCSQDCYFDQDSGSGNDRCDWDRSCDPLEVAPECPYDPDNAACESFLAEQPQRCTDACAPLTPNGCDCFGCCRFPGATTAIWLGSEVDGMPSCSLEFVDDPTRCFPCTQVPSCLNTCEDCELCVGKRELADDCTSDAGTTEQCPPGFQPCGLSGQSACPSGYYCITGCCIQTVR